MPSSSFAKNLNIVASCSIMSGQHLSTQPFPQCNFAGFCCLLKNLWVTARYYTVEYIRSRIPALSQLQHLLYCFNFLFQRKWNFCLFTHTQRFLAHVLPQNLYCLLAGVSHKPVCQKSQVLLIDVIQPFGMILVSADICPIVFYVVESHWKL